MDPNSTLPRHESVRRHREARRRRLDGAHPYVSRQWRDCQVLEEEAFRLVRRHLLGNSYIGEQQLKSNVEIAGREEDEARRCLLANLYHPYICGCSGACQQSPAEEDSGRAATLLFEKLHIGEQQPIVESDVEIRRREHEARHQLIKEHHIFYMQEIQKRKESALMRWREFEARRQRRKEDQKMTDDTSTLLGQLTLPPN